MGTSYNGTWLVGHRAAQAVQPADKCEASKLKAAGKYEFCRLKAGAKAVKMVDYSKCDEIYSFKWQLAEGQAGTGVGLADRLRPQPIAVVRASTHEARDPPVNAR